MAEQEALDSHDESVRIAYLPDTVKIHHEKGYPAPGVRQRLKDESSMYFELISAADLLNGCLLKRYRAHESDALSASPDVFLCGVQGIHGALHPRWLRTKYQKWPWGKGPCPHRGVCSRLALMRSVMVCPDLMDLIFRQAAAASSVSVQGPI